MAAKQIDEKLLLSLYNEGKTLQEIAKVIGASTNAISDILKKYNEEVPNELFAMVNGYITSIESNIDKIEKIMEDEYDSKDYQEYKKTEKLWLENIVIKMKFIKDREQLSNVLK